MNAYKLLVHDQLSIIVPLKVLFMNVVAVYSTCGRKDEAIRLA